MKIKLNYLFFGVFLILLHACTQQVPKEKAYPRVYFPKKSYKKFKSECNYSFEIPTYCQVENKEFFRNERLKSDSCWVNIVFGSFNGKLHVSYKHFENQDSLTQLMEQHYKLTSKHIVKATYIKDSVIDKPNLKGLIYSVGGNAASDMQFLLTDTKHKFLRGALYFNNTPNIDSMRPVIQFVNEDIMHLIETFKFE
jgi:gliding motility-associated lipoprotein GldD